MTFMSLHYIQWHQIVILSYIFGQNIFTFQVRINRDRVGSHREQKMKEEVNAWR